MVSQKKPAAVLLSHSHYDHTSALPQLVYSRHQDQQQVIAEQESLCGRPVLMPTEAELPVQRMMEAVMALSRGEASSVHEMSEEVVVPEMVFFCDSTIENLTKHKEWKRYPVLVVECTGYPLRHTVESHVGHTHLSQLEEVMVENKQKQWVLVHASSTMRNRELAEEEVRLKSLGLNVVILRD